MLSFPTFSVDLNCHQTISCIHSRKYFCRNTPNTLTKIYDGQEAFQGLSVSHENWII